MKSNENLGNNAQAPKVIEPKTKNLSRLAFLMAILGVGGILAYQVMKTPSAIEPSSTSTNSLPNAYNNTPAELQPASVTQEKTTPQPGSTPVVKPAVKPIMSAPPGRESDAVGKEVSEDSGSAAAAQEAIIRLFQIDPSRGPLNKDQVKELNQSMKKLAAQGPAAVPAIREFLEKNQDINFAELADGNPLDNASLRLGLIDALEKIGGPEALATTVKTLESTGDPLEIALLTRGLEKQSPGEYREMELKAALEALTMAYNNQLNGRNVNPLFEVFQHYGDASVVPELEKAVAKTEWRYQASTALSEMPDGAGIPALIKLAKDPQVSALDQGDVALRALAQVATKYPDAQAALLEQARSNKIPESAWPAVASALSGTYVFAYPHKVLGTPDSFPGLVDPQIPERLALMDEMISAASANSAATAALKEHRAALASRLSSK